MHVIAKRFYAARKRVSIFFFRISDQHMKIDNDIYESEETGVEWVEFATIYAVRK